MTPRNVEQNQQIRDERREQILNAALKLFAQKGVFATKISDIAGLAGLSHGLVYHYFHSKDEIFSELVRIAITSADMAFRFSLEVPLPPLEKLTFLTETLLTHAYLGDGPYYFYLMSMAFTLDSVPDEVKTCLEEFQPVQLKYLLSVLTEGQENGQIVDGDPLQLATLYISIVQGLAILRMTDRFPSPLPTTEMVMRMFRKENESEGVVRHE